VLGIEIKLMLLDRGLYSVRVIRDLIAAELPFIIPAVKRGKKPTTPGGPTGAYALAVAKQGRWTSYTLKSAQDSQVDFDLAVVCHNTRGKRGANQREALLYASWGVQRRSLSWVRATYRGRFGIEASYRQVHQARIRTRTRNPALRLLFVAIALILHNIWVWLHAEVLAEPRRGGLRSRPASLRLDRLLMWLVIEIAKHYRFLRNVAVYRDIYERGAGLWHHFQLLRLRDLLSDCCSERRPSLGR
jgi:predicted small integral membrane protein